MADEATVVWLNSRRRARAGRYAAWTVVAGLATIAVLLARRPAVQGEVVYLPNPLNAPIAELHLHQVPVAQAIIVLREKTHTNVVVDWADQQRQPGVPATAAVMVDLHDVTLRAALDVLLAQLGAYDYAIDAEGGVVHVRFQHPTLVVRAYDVRDLLADPEADPHPAVGGAEEALLTCIQDVGGYGDYRAYRSGPKPTRLAELWGGRLVVTDSRDGQNVVERTLAELRRTMRAPTTRASR